MWKGLNEFVIYNKGFDTIRKISKLANLWVRLLASVVVLMRRDVDDGDVKQSAVIMVTNKLDHIKIR